MSREPALILGAVQAVIALAITFGFDLSTEQVGAILALTAVVLAILTRTQVSPAGPKPTAADTDEAPITPDEP